MIPLPRLAADTMSAALAEKYPGWEIGLSPRGMWHATRRSADGRTSHYVICFTAGELAGKLAEITAQSPRAAASRSAPRR